jgi:hypothetical protein
MVDVPQNPGEGGLPQSAMAFQAAGQGPDEGPHSPGDTPEQAGEEPEVPPATGTADEQVAQVAVPAPDGP